MAELEQDKLTDNGLLKVWVVSTVVPNSLDPCVPEVLPTREAAEAHLGERLREEWEYHGDCDDAGERLPYPGDWRQALAAMSKDPLWGRWELTSHNVPASAVAIERSATPGLPDHGAIAAGLEACDWSNVPIGNKAIIRAAIESLKSGAAPTAGPDWKAIAETLASVTLNCGDQMSQMAGMFDDSDGQIANAMAEAGEALESFYEADGRGMPWRAWHDAGEDKDKDKDVSPLL